MKQENLEREKRASFLFAPLVHVLQNVGLSKLLKSKAGNNYISKSFSHAVQGKPVTKLRSLSEGIVGGSLIPEAPYLANVARDAGDTFRNKMIDQGVQKIQGRSALALRYLTEGKYTALLNPKLYKNKETAKIIKAFSETSGVPLTAILNAPNSKLHMAKLEHLWSSGDSVFQKNILPGLTRSSKPSKSFKGISFGLNKVITKNPKTEALGNILGSGLIAPFDPITAAMNTGKNLITNSKSTEIINRFGLGKRSLKRIDDVFLNKPLEKSYQAGNIKKKEGPISSFFNRYFLNAGVHEARKTSYDLGNVSKGLGLSKVKLKK